MVDDIIHEIYDNACEELGKVSGEAARAIRSHVEWLEKQYPHLVVGLITT